MEIDLYALHPDYLKTKLKILQLLYNRANREHNMKRINEIIPEALQISEVLSEKEVFEKARKLYPGSKRGNETELQVLKKKHKDWKQILPLLEEGVKKEIAYRKRAEQVPGRFIPPWKNFQTWLNQRCWEQEFEQLPKMTW